MCHQKTLMHAQHVWTVPVTACISEVVADAADNAVYGRLRWRCSVDLAWKTHRGLLRHSRHLVLRSACRKLCSRHYSHSHDSLLGVNPSKRISKPSEIFTNSLREFWSGGYPLPRLLYFRAWVVVKKRVMCFGVTPRQKNSWLLPVTFAICYRPSVCRLSVCRL